MLYSEKSLFVVSFIKKLQYTVRKKRNFEVLSIFVCIVTTEFQRADHGWRFLENLPEILCQNGEGHSVSGACFFNQITSQHIRV
jgi:hypothetical protein